MFSALYPCFALNMCRSAHASGSMVRIPSCETNRRYVLAADLGLGGPGSTVATRPIVRRLGHRDLSLARLTAARSWLSMRCSSQNLLTWRRENVT